MQARKPKSVMRRVLVGLTVATMAIGGSLVLEQDAGATSKGKTSSSQEHGNGNGGDHGGGGGGDHSGGGGGGGGGDHGGGGGDHCDDGHGHDGEKNKHCVPEDPSD
jgi:hypothetical protein